MTEELSVPVWEHLRVLVAQDDKAELDDFLDTLSGHEIVRSLFRLTEEEQRQLLRALPADQAAELVGEVPEAAAADLMEGLTPAEAASIVTLMPSDERADLLAARDLMSFPSDSAGGLMVREYLAFRARHTAREVIRPCCGFRACAYHSD